MDIMCKKRKIIWLLPFCFIILLCLVIPLVYMLISSFQEDVSGRWTLYNYMQSLTKPYYYRSFLNSGLIAIFSSIFGMIGSLVFCTALLSLPKKKQEQWLLLSNLAANFAGIPLAFGFIILLGNAGVLKMIFPFLMGFDLYSWQGLVLTYVYFQIPLATIFIYPVMKKIRKEWQESAEILGASKWYYYRKIVYPFMAPALFNTFVILFANGMGTYETAYALVGSNVNLVTIRISSLVAGDVYAKPNIGSSLSVLFSLAMMLAVLLSQRLIKRVERKNYE